MDFSLATDLYLSRLTMVFLLHSTIYKLSPLAPLSNIDICIYASIPSLSLPCQTCKRFAAYQICTSLTLRIY